MSASNVSASPITKQVVKGEADRATELYLDLFKRCLTRQLFDDHYRIIPRNVKTPWHAMTSAGYGTINGVLDSSGSPWFNKASSAANR